MRDGVTTHHILMIGPLLLLALLMRMTPQEPVAPLLALSDEHRPVAAAIGLTDQMPEEATLATYVNAALYSCHYRMLALLAPGTSPIDFGASFLSDPAGFSALARNASLVAAIISVMLLWLLISRLLDPVAATAAAFALAIHPAAIGLSAPGSSGAFSLLFLLVALLVASEFTQPKARYVELIAIGLCLGFAMEALPTAALAVPIVGLLLFRRLPAADRPSAFAVAAGLACFTATTALVAPGLLHNAAPVAAVALLIALVSVAAFCALTTLRGAISPQHYTSAILAAALLTGLWTVSSIDSINSQNHLSSSAAASQWVIEHLPADSMIVVHPTLSAEVSVPRNTRSLKRELHSGPTASYSRLYLLAATRAASSAPGPSWDLHFSSDPIRAALQSTRRVGEPQQQRFLLLPDAIDPTELAEADFWLVARFRSHDPSSTGVAIWGTGGITAPPEPIHVHWHIRHAGRLAHALNLNSTGA